MAWGELAALLVTGTLPARLPALAGSNVTLNEVACPTASVIGTVKPPTVNPAPLSLICERVTLPLPLLVTVTLCVVLVPVVMLPKLSDAGVTVSCRSGTMPAPVNATTSGEFGVLLTSVRLPVKLLAEAGVNPMVKTEDPPGATESGTVKPLKAKPVPASTACVTLRFAVPVFRMVSDCVLLTPTVTFPKLTLAGVTEICACAPVPLSAIVAGEFVALLVTVTLPERLAAVAGANVTLNVMDCPAASASGTVNPATLNPVPLSLICEIVTLELPVFFSVTLCVALVPVTTLPKLSDAGLTVSCSADATPVPASATTSGELGAFLTSVTLPVKLLAVADVNPSVKVEVPPGATVSGNVRPLKVKPLPASAACVTLRFAVPVFLIVSN